jgi:uncharacterized membrane protein
MESMFSKHRLEALSDGIFAIVMTLLILDLKVPLDIPAGHLGQAVLQQSHEWASFLITFLLAARYWTLQHRLFELIEKIQPRTVVTTFIFLLLVTILPFSTSLWGHYLNDPLAFFLYILNQVLIGIVVLTEMLLARRENNIRRGDALWVLSGRLYVMIGSLLAALLTACFLQAQYVGLIAALVAVSARRLREFLHKRYLKRHAPLPEPAQQ